MSSVSIIQEHFEASRIKKHRRLAHRLVLYILLFSSIVTFIATALQLHREYSRDVSDIDTRLTQIEHSYLNSISLSLWSMDYEQLRAQLLGIQALPDIDFLEVTTEEGTLLIVGDKSSGKLLHRDYSLTRLYRGNRVQLGNLRVTANLGAVYQRLYDRVLIIFGVQAIKTFLVATFIFVMFQYLVTRHLQSISRYVRSRRLGDVAEPLSLGRNKTDSECADELDDVVTAFNQMCSSLDESYQRLAENEERFDLAMRGANDGLWDWDVVNQSAYYSPRCGEIMGFDPDHIGGPDEWYAYIHPEDREGLRSCLRSHLKGAAPQFEYVFRSPRKDDRVNWVLCRGQALRDSDERAYRVVGTVMDISRQKESEAALAAATAQLREEQGKRAEAQRLACIGELSASIAHEIRNPLASIVNALALLSMDDFDAHERVRVVDIVNRETLRLQRILNEFLDFARIDQPTMESGDIAQLLRESADSVAMTLSDEASHSERIQLNLDIPEAAAPVRFDAGQLHRVIWNLALNGIQAMPDGGRLGISCEVEQNKVRVCITDTGCGVPEDIRDDIIKPFFTSREDGTGLGLSIVHRILEQHGSRIIVQSTASQGSRFCFELPLEMGS